MYRGVCASNEKASAATIWTSVGNALLCRAKFIVLPVNGLENFEVAEVKLDSRVLRIARGTAEMVLSKRTQISPLRESKMRWLDALGLLRSSIEDTEAGRKRVARVSIPPLTGSSVHDTVKGGLVRLANMTAGKSVRVPVVFDEERDGIAIMSEGLGIRLHTEQTVDDCRLEFDTLVALPSQEVVKKSYTDLLKKTVSYNLLTEKPVDLTLWSHLLPTLRPVYPDLDAYRNRSVFGLPTVEITGDEVLTGEDKFQLLWQYAIVGSTKHFGAESTAIANMH